MKKIIDNKRYDTESAKFIGSADWGQPGSFEHCEEDLYRKRTGEYFLHGFGGPQSKYAESRGQNEWSGGEQITPLSLESASEWAQANLSADEYESAFGPVSEDDGDVLIGVRISANAKRVLDLESSRTGKTQAAIIDALICDHLR